jgi:hypothetical protein
MRLLVIALAACSATPVTTTTSVTPPVVELAEASAPVVEADPPKPIQCLTRHYEAVARRDADGWSLVPTGGEAIQYGMVTEVYEPRYVTGPIRPVTDVDDDPGRVRIDALFFATYGKNAKEVEAALTRVSIGHKVVLVHRKIAEPLRRVATRIDAAMKADPTLGRFFESLGGTFNWRFIAGTRELSMHAWAIAIDLDTKRANYWHNETHDESAPLVWKNQYPQAIVDAFEAEGFAWGGRWYHFDTMHFEYRPELLDPECYPPVPTR